MPIDVTPQDLDDSQSDMIDDDPFATFAEWDSTADAEAYTGL